MDLCFDIGSLNIEHRKTRHIQGHQKIPKYTVYMECVTQILHGPMLCSKCINVAHANDCTNILVMAIVKEHKVLLEMFKNIH